MRFSKKTTLALALTLACGTAVAGDGPKPVTYLKGNIEGITQNAAGTLDLASPKGLTLRASDGKFEVPYSAIMNTERKDGIVITEKDPLYKVWTLHKRIVMAVPPQEVSFDYKDKTGTLHSMTLEMETGTADRFFARIQQAEEKKAAMKGNWWGDSVWKTHRNESEWNAQHEAEDKAVASTK